MCDIYYVSQDDFLETPDVTHLGELLSEFHEVKPVILEKGYRTKKDWRIPKLEQLHSLVLSVPQVGAPRQHTTDRSEHAHIESVKEPFRGSNHKDVAPQTCRWLDRLEKRRHFDLAIAIHNSNVDIREERPTSYSSLVLPTTSWLAELKTIENLTGPARDKTDYFTLADHVVELTCERKLPQKRLTRMRTFRTPVSAYHLRCDPNMTHVSIDEAAQLFELPDLRRAIEEFYGNEQVPHDESGPVLGVRAWYDESTPIPFDKINIWYSLKVQTVNTRRSGCGEARTVSAQPPSPEWKAGRYDSCLFMNHNCPPWTGKANLKGQSN
jgi:hypothetical protein